MTATAKQLKQALLLLTTTLALGLTLCLCPTALAKDTYIIDQYDLYDASTQADLESKAKDMADTYGVATYLLVVDDIDSYTAREYAKNYWINCDLGIGSEKSGILFMIAVDSRDYVTITHGQGVYNFTDYEIGVLEDRVVDPLGDDKWIDAADAYLAECERALSFCAENGEPLDQDNDPEIAFAMKLLGLGVALILGIVVLIVVRKVLKGQLKSVAAGFSADNYLAGVSNIQGDEHFMGTTVSKTPRAKDDDNSGGGSWVDSGGFGGSSGGKF